MLVNTPGLSIVIPIYNERPHCESLLRELRELSLAIALPHEFLLVDDGSADGSSEMLASQDFAQVLRHPQNRGYGASLKTGIIQAKYDWIATLDADLEFRPRELLKLIPRQDWEMVIGARVGNSRSSFPWYQRGAKALVCTLMSLRFGQKILDINSGLRLMRRSTVLKYISLLPNGFSFSASITLAMLLGGEKLLFIPADYQRRREKSKVRVPSYTLNFLRSFYRVYLNSSKI